MVMVMVVMTVVDPAHTGPILRTQHVVAARHSGTAAVPSLLRDNVPYRMFSCTIRWRNSSLHVRRLAPDNLGLGGSELAPRVNWSCM